MGKAQAEVTRLGNEGSASLKKLETVGKYAFLGLAAGATVLGVESIKAAASFQTSMKLIQTQAHRSAAEVADFSKQVLAMAGSVATSPDELSKGLYHLASTGMDAKRTMEALKIAAEGAKLGNADLESVTNALNATIVSGIKGSKDFGSAMGALNAIVGSGDMHMQDLADALGTGVLTTAARFGVSLRDVGAALAVFGDNNIRGADAATKLSQAITYMMKPAAGADKVFKTIGLSSRQLRVDMGSSGLGKVLTDLHDHLQAAGVTGSLTGQFLLDAFGRKPANAINALLGEFDRFKQKQAEVQGGSKNFASDWKAYTQTFGYSWDRAKAAFEAMTIQLGTKLLPTATKVMNWIGTTGVGDLQKFGGWVKQNWEWLKKVGEILVVAYGAMKLYAIQTSLAATASSIFAGKTAAAGAAAATAGAEASIAAGKFGSFAAVAAGALGIANFISNPKSLGFPMGFNQDIGPGKKRVAGVTYYDKNGNAYTDPGLKHSLSSGGAAMDPALAGLLTTGLPAGTQSSASKFAELPGRNVKQVAASHLGTAKAAGNKIGAALGGGISDALKNAILGGSYGGGAGGAGGGSKKSVAKTLDASLQKLVDSTQAKIKTTLAALSTKVKDARDKLTSDLAAQGSFSASLASSVLGGSAFTNAVDSNGGMYSGGISAFLSNQLAGLTGQRDSLQSLANQHLNPDALKQLAEMNPADEARYASFINVGQTNSLMSQLTGVANQIGNIVGTPTYAQQIAADTKARDDALAEQKKQTVILDKLAAQIGREVAKALASPAGAKALRSELTKLGKGGSSTAFAV